MYELVMIRDKKNQEYVEVFKRESITITELEKAPR